MNRSLFQTQFTLDNVPHWGCPTCGKGILQASKDLFITKESYNSREYCRNSPNSKPWEDCSYIYTCFLTCSNAACQEVVVNTGEVIADVIVIYEECDKFTGELIDVKDYADCYRPQYFQPNLKIISIPKKCPKAVKKSLDESFKLFFASPSAAANGVRIALEKLLDELKIDRCRFDDNNEEVRLSLGYRIGKLPNEYSHVKEMIKAVKWLGNAGSHSNDEIKIDDVMDAYELTEHILEEIYEEPKVERIKAIARKINENKGPI